MFLWSQELQEKKQGISQERDELLNKVVSLENKLKAAAEENATTERESVESKEEVQLVKNQLLQLKENLQVEQKEKEVSCRSEKPPSLPSPSIFSLPKRSLLFSIGENYLHTAML